MLIVAPPVSPVPRIDAPFEIKPEVNSQSTEHIRLTPRQHTLRAGIITRIGWRRFT